MNDYDNFESLFEEDIKIKAVTSRLFQKESLLCTDDYTIKNGKNWSLLSNQVVGSEIF